MKYSSANTHILAYQTPKDTITKDIHIDFFFLETILASPSKYFRSPKIVHNFTLKSVDNF